MTHFLLAAMNVKMFSIEPSRGFVRNHSLNDAKTFFKKTFLDSLKLTNANVLLFTLVFSKALALKPPA